MQSQWILMIPLFLGICIVLQGALNREIARNWGLAGAVFLNNLVFLMLGLVLFLTVRKVPNIFPDVFRDRGAFGMVYWWYLLPGILGFAIVTGAPWAMSRIGAFHFVVLVIAAQMVAGLAWDATVNGLPLTTVRTLGAMLGIAGAVLVSWK
ncbi:MAG: DMT family transporter [Deltaproteobacteria bacterium]|nr:DMT family transporter [Deltaproteobacteria bacterium]